MLHKKRKCLHSNLNQCLSFLSCRSEKEFSQIWNKLFPNKIAELSWNLSFLGSLFRQLIRQLCTNAEFYLLSGQVFLILFFKGEKKKKGDAFPRYWTLNTFADLKSDGSVTCESSAYPALLLSNHLHSPPYLRLCI